MAKLGLIETIQTKLSTLSKTDGQLIVVRDNASLYVDLNGSRVYISDWIDIDTDANRLAMLSPLSNKYYYVIETNKIWRYVSGNWVQVTLHNAKDIVYDNTASGLAATDVNGAIDEIVDNVDTLETNISGIADDVSVLDAKILTTEENIDTINDTLENTMIPKYITFGLSEPGWYRIARMDARMEQGVLGGCCNGCKLEIKRYGSNSGTINAENHIVDMLPTYNNANFENEVSVSDELLITKIRYWIDPIISGGSYNASIDIYYAGSTYASGVIIMSNYVTPTLVTEWEFTTAHLSGSPLADDFSFGSLLTEYEFSANKSYESEIQAIRSAQAVPSDITTIKALADATTVDTSYFIATSAALTDYPEALTNLSATLYARISIKVDGTIRHIEIVAVNPNGIAYTMNGYTNTNSSVIVWGKGTANLDSKANTKNISYTDSSYGGNFPKVIQQAVADGVLTTGTWSGRVVAGGSIGYYSGVLSGDYASFNVHSYGSQFNYHLMKTASGWSIDQIARTSQIENLNTAVSKLKYEWTANVKFGTWSRLCYVPVNMPYACSYLLSIGLTRTGILVNSTYLVTSSGSGYATIVKVGGDNYTFGTTDGYKTSVRIVNDNRGNGYFEIKDETIATAVSVTEQTVRCSLIPILTGTVTTYTEITDGTTMSDEFTVAKEMLVTKTDFQSDITDAFLANKQLNTYMGLESIGITEGEETPEAIANALPNCSMLMYSIGYINESAPSMYSNLLGDIGKYGTVTVYKLTPYRTWFEYTTHNENNRAFAVHYTYTSGESTWHDWVDYATKSDIDAINSRLAYKDISSSIDVGDTGCTASGYVENGMVVLSVTIPAGTAGNTTLSMTIDTVYAPRILTKGAFLPADSASIDNVKISWVNATGNISIGVKTELTVNGYVTFTYPLKTS